VNINASILKSVKFIKSIADGISFKCESDYLNVATLLNDLKVEVDRKIKKKELVVKKSDPAYQKKIRSGDFFYEADFILLDKPATAVKKLEPLARKGNIDAQMLIGKTFLYGVTGELGEVKMLDRGLGLMWLNQAWKSGNMDALYLIAEYEKSCFNFVEYKRLKKILDKSGYQCVAQQV
jgi:hypothetical protein